MAKYLNLTNKSVYLEYLERKSIDILCFGVLNTV